MNHRFSIKMDSILLLPLNEITGEQYRVLRNKKYVSKWFFHSAEITEQQQSEWFKSYLNNTSDIMFSIHLNDSQKTFIGANAIYDIQEREGIGEYGRVIIDPRFAGRGYGYSATLAACIFAKDTLKLHKLILYVYQDNLAAVRTYVRSGFKHLNFITDETGNKMIYMEKEL